MLSMMLSSILDSRHLAVDFDCRENLLTINAVQTVQNIFQKKVKLFCRIETYFIYLRKNNERRNLQV